MNNVEIKILNDKKEVISVYYIHRLNVRANARRVAMISVILELNCSEAEKSHLMTCAALACTLRDKKGDLLFPEDNGWERISEEMGLEEYVLLSQHYVTVNPNEQTLTAKKKKF